MAPKICEVLVQGSRCETAITYRLNHDAGDLVRVGFGGRPAVLKVALALLLDLMKDHAR